MNDHNPSEDKPTGATERLTEGDPLPGGSDEPAAGTDDAPDAEPAGEPGDAPGVERPVADEADAGRPADVPAAGAAAAAPPHTSATEPVPTAALPGGWIPPGGGYSPRAGSGGEWSGAPGTGREWSGPANPGGPEWAGAAGTTGGDPFGDAPFADEDPTRPLAAATESPRRLRRSSADRMIGGVAGGLGRYFDVDPVLFRIAFVVLCFAGGAGLLAYLGLWLITPSDGPAPPATQTGVRALAVIGGVVLVCVSLPFLLLGAFLSIPLLPLALVLLTVILLARGARGKADDDTSDLLARVVLVLLVVVVSIAAFVTAAAGAALGGGAVIAGVVIALGIGLIAAAFLGRGSGARWLVLPAVVLAAPLGLVAASGLDLTGGMGERDYHPTNVSALGDIPKLGAGEMKVDLRDLQLPDGRTPVNLKVGAGHIVVYVPEDVCVSSHVKLGAGYAQVLDRDTGGFDVDWPNRRTPPSGVPTLDLHANVGLGAVEVRYNDGHPYGHFGRAGAQGRNGIDACTPV